MKKQLTVAMSFVIFLVIAQNPIMVEASASEGTVSLDNLASKIVTETTNPGMSQFEMAVALYDYLIDNTVYKGSITDPDHVLRKGEASCGGYANAYKLLLSKVGIKSKTINGSVFTLGHVWNLVKFDGEWYHVDVRMADHLLGTEDRYRRFGMSDEQASLEYRFNKLGAQSHSSNYAYKTGALDSAIAYIRDAIDAQVRNGEKLFIIDPMAEGAPPELQDPFNRILVKNVLRNLQIDYPGSPGGASASLTLRHNLLLVDIKTPTYRVTKLTQTAPVDIVVEVADNDFSKAAALQLGDKILIDPSYATKPKLFWKSYREKTAIVDQNGTVTIVGYGKAKIKASTIDGSKLTLNFNVIVKK